jgi:hypothetical protein
VQRFIPRLPTLNKALQVSLLAYASLFGLAFLAISIKTLAFPFPLEWMEGQTLEVVSRMLEGAPLYTSPTLEYVPFIYPPLYYWLTAVISEVVGLDFFVPRFLSLLSTLGTCGVIALWLRKEGSNWPITFTGPLTFLATYPLSGRWFDMARVDSLFLFLTLCGLYVLVYHQTTRGAVLSSTLLSAAFLTKQTALMIALPVFGSLLFLSPRHTLKTGALLTALLGASTLALHISSEGWSTFYTLELPKAHPIHPPAWKEFWTQDVAPVGLLFTLSTGALALLLRQTPKKGILYLGLAIGLVGASYSSRLHSFGYINVLMPLHVFAAFGSALCLTLLSKDPHRTRLLTCACLIALLQLGGLTYNPTRLIPSHQCTQKNQAFLQNLAECPHREILFPDIAFSPRQAGKPSQGLGMAAYDLLRARLPVSRQTAQRAFQRDLEGAIAQGRFQAILPGPVLPLPGLLTHYEPAGFLGEPLPFVAGAIPLHPTLLYIKKPHPKETPSGTSSPF